MIAAGAGGVFVCRNLACDGPGFGKVQSLGTPTPKSSSSTTRCWIIIITGDESEKQGAAAVPGAGWVETGDSFLGMVSRMATGIGVRLPALWRCAVRPEQSFLQRIDE
ncbi:MAG: hypothetical protein IPI73_16175 [Betaproteobacteria bacterium]|nr:hypothetical protein [Betaproteobacteria bacterium]